MGTRTEYDVTTINWIADPNSYSQNTGRKVNWDVVALGSDASKRMASGQIVSLWGDGLAPRADASIALASATEDGAGTATYTSSADHNLAVGNTVIISEFATTEYNGEFEVASVPSATTFTVEGIEGTPADDGAGGTAEVKALGLLLESIDVDERERSLSGQAVVIGGVVYKNLLPDSGETDFDAWVTEIEEESTGFVFETFSDTRAS